MASRSALAYPNSDDRNSAKKAPVSPFNRVAQVRASTLSIHLQGLIIAMLKFNRFGDELWASTESLRVVIGQVNRRSRKGACERVCRRTVQHRLHEAMDMGVLEMVYPANSRIRYRGQVVFRHTATYRLNPDKLVPRLTWEEWQQTLPVRKPAAGTDCRRPAGSEDSAAENTSSTPPTSSPQATASSPAQNISGPAPVSTRIRQLTSRERSRLVEAVAQYMRGHTYSGSGRDGFGSKLSPGDPQYEAPMNLRDAILAACKLHLFPIESAVLALRLAGHLVPENISAQPEGEST
jgi:hypothetical protein